MEEGCSSLLRILEIFQFIAISMKTIWKIFLLKSKNHLNHSLSLYVDCQTGIFESPEILLRQLDSLNIEYLILGDTNFNLAAARCGNDACNLVSTTYVYGLHQVINEQQR